MPRRERVVQSPRNPRDQVERVAPRYGSLELVLGGPDEALHLGETCLWLCTICIAQLAWAKKKKPYLKSHWEFRSSPCSHHG